MDDPIKIEPLSPKNITKEDLEDCEKWQGLDNVEVTKTEVSEGLCDCDATRKEEGAVDTEVKPIKLCDHLYPAGNVLLLVLMKASPSENEDGDCEIALQHQFQKTDAGAKERGNLANFALCDNEQHIKCLTCNKAVKWKRDSSKDKLKDTEKKRFNCPHCNKTYSKRGNLSDHINVTHMNGRYRCNHCTYTSARESPLETHMALKHTKEEAMKCSVCKKLFSRRGDLDRHLKIHNERINRFRCPHCESIYHTKSVLAYHINTEHLNNKDYRCEHYAFSTDQECNLESYITEKHGELIAEKDEMKFKCDHCNYQTNQNHVFRKHVLVHIDEKPLKCPHCEKLFDKKSDLSRHLKIHNEKKERGYHCSHCSKSYIKFSYLTEHIQIKHLNRKYKCSKCEYTVSRKNSMKIHFLTKHGRGVIEEVTKKFKCNNCSYSSNSSSNVHRHNRYKHTIKNKIEGKNVKCPHCKNSYYDKDSLACHIDSKHLNNRKYKCTNCNYATAYRSSLRVHKLLRHTSDTKTYRENCEYSICLKGDPPEIVPKEEPLDVM